MPNLRGKTKRQVLALLAPLRVDVAMAGRGVVVDQDVVPGSPVDPGTKVRLTLDSQTVRTAAVLNAPAAARPGPTAKLAADRGSLRAAGVGFAGESSSEAAERAGTRLPSEPTEDAER